ncbi:helix-turn-helix domain-containing protein [Aquibaculum arenosum]|uniref:helix-turn-helix domain-containing protein n=1 Tax=Aquibaculum arenosum TaxID=3032591 RepID=UPI002AC3353D|nr:XRE family transcriptional regulator [Fodinicurvata sp. CAU 1616]
MRTRKDTHRAAKPPPSKSTPVKPAPRNGEEPDLTTGSNAPRARDGGLQEAIGVQVRSLRKQQEMTVVELAGQAGLSAGMLSKIENGGICPSLNTLQALAHALNVPITAFFEKFEERRDASYVPAGAGVTIERRGSKAGHRYQLLGHSLGGDIAVEPYLVTLSEGAQPYGSFRHEGVEFIHLLEGRVRYRHGDRVIDMGPGDSLFFDAAAPHGPETLEELPLRLLSIIIYPRS